MFILENFDIVFSQTSSKEDVLILVVEQQDLPSLGSPHFMRRRQTLTHFFLDVFFSKEEGFSVEIPEKVFLALDVSNCWICSLDNQEVVFEKHLPIQE